MEGTQNLQTIGKYIIQGTLGRGSMGVVYKAQDPEIGRTVAIKTLRKITAAQFSDADAALERFKIEARSAGNIRHPNIITIFEVSVEGDTPYIVMDYVEGESFEGILARDGKLQPTQVINYLQQLAGGIDAAHSKGVIHRDLKPANIIRDDNDQVYILDFGVAKINQSISESDNLVQAEPVMGTPGYMSPEQILNERLDERSDLFSFAIVAFELFSGSRPFPGTTFNEVVGGILNSRPLSLSEIAPELPLALEEVFERGLAKKREQRFDTAKEFVAALKRAVGVGQDLPPISQEGDHPEIRRRKVSEWKSLAEDSAASARESRESQTYSRPSKGSHVPLGFGDRSSADSTRQVQRGFEDGFYSTPSEEPAPPERTGPGALFAHAESPLGTRDMFGDRRRGRLRFFTSIVAVVCLVLGGVILFLLSEKESGPNILTTESASQPVAQVSTATLQQPTLPVEPIPEGKSVSDMTDGELRSVFLTDGVSEKTLIEALQEVRTRAIADIVPATARALKNDSYVVRIEVVKFLSELGTQGDKSIAPLLVTHLDDHDPLVRAHVAKALGQLGSRASVAFLRNRFINEKDDRVKNSIREAIENINGYPMEPLS
ncbi:MAG: protein kinase [Bdellovibrionales bacterium]|nr:protein kinase [Bdellovibrionales bacterium]